MFLFSNFLVNSKLLNFRIIKCATGRRGRFLLALAGKKTAKLDPPLNNVPLLYLDGEKSIDAFYNLEEAVCNKMQPKPAECAK